MHPNPAMTKTRRFPPWVPVVALCCAQFALGYSSAWNKTPVYDEPAHLFAGYSYLCTGDFRLMPSHPPLAELLAAAPLLLTDVAMPRIHEPGSLIASAWNRGANFQIARGWLYLSGNDPEQILRVARLPMLGIMVLGGLCLYRVTRAALGHGPGLLALALWTFSPGILAHGRWVTTDLPVAVCFFAATFAFWQLTARISATRFLAAALWTSALFLTKFSAGLFVAVMLLLVALRLLQRSDLAIYLPRRPATLVPGTQPWRRLAWLAAVSIAIGIVCTMSIWACFGFRYSASSDGAFHLAGFSEERTRQTEQQAWRTLCEDSTGRPAPLRRAIAQAARLRLLPEAYLFGLAHTLKSAEARVAYLRGELRTKGWWYYFPYVLLVKTPLPVLLLCALGTLGWYARYRSSDPPSGRPNLETLQPIAAFLFIYACAAIASSINIGHRHLLPVYPFLFLIAAGAARFFRAGAPALPKTLVCLLLLLHAAGSLRAWPHYLSYFNLPAGGPAQGWRHLSDSNIDWGQDLVHLRRYLDRHPALLPQGQHLKLAYFGMADPSHYLGTVDMLPSSPAFQPDVVAAMAPERDDPVPVPITPGIYAISVTLLTGLYLPEPGPWTDNHRQRLDEAVTIETALRRAGNDQSSTAAIVRDHRQHLAPLFPPESRQAFLQDPDAFRQYHQPLLSEAACLLNNLRFLKLILYLRAQQPLARIGGSICLFRVTDREIHEALP